MKLNMNFAVMTIFVFLFNTAYADSQIAQCIHTSGMLNVSATVKTTRGTEFFEWVLENIESNNLLGSRKGFSVTNLIDNVTIQQSFDVSISTAANQGEVAIEIKNTNLNPLSQKTDFNFSCKVISY